MVNRSEQIISKVSGAMKNRIPVEHITGLPCEDGRYEIDYGFSRILEIQLQGVELLNRSNKILVCFSGAIGQRKGKTAPFFSGLGLAKELPSTIVSISDPTLTLDDELGLSWYAGYSGWRCIFEDIAKLLGIFSSHSDAELVLFGGSGGGYASIAVGSLLRVAAKILVWNPQTAISNYDPFFVDRYLRAAFPEVLAELDEVADKPVKVRRAVYRNIMQRNGVLQDVTNLELGPSIEILYLQNKGDWHLRGHLAPFLTANIKAHGLRRHGLSAFSTQQNKVFLYIGEWGDGHAAPPKGATQALLSAVVNGFSFCQILEQLDGGSIPGIPVAARTGMIKADSDKLNCFVSVVGDELQIRSGYSADDVLFAFWLLSASGERTVVRDFEPQPSFSVPVDMAKDAIEIVALVKDIAGFITRTRTANPLFQRRSVEFAESENLVSNVSISWNADVVFCDAYKAEGENIFKSLVGPELSGVVIAEYERLQTQDALFEFSNQANACGCIAIPSFFDAGAAICDKAVYSEDANFLFFRDSELSFFVVQVRRVVDGFYFPKLGIFYGRVLGSVASQVRKLARQGEELELKKYLSDNSIKSFKGWLATQRLPYHFFYDVMPAVHAVIKGGSRYPVLSFKDACYLAIEDFYHCQAVRMEPTDLLVWNPNGFYLSLLRNEHADRAVMHAEVDKHLVSKIVSQKNRYSRGLGLAGSRPVIWLGILAGKRKWINQAQAFSLLVDRLKAKYTAPFFIFDGITSTLDCPIDGDEHQVVIDEILSLSPNTSYLNLNGATAAEKIFFSNAIDFYACDGATASMYVSRLAKRKGVLFSVPGAKLWGHIHNEARFFPSDMVRPVSMDGSSWEFTDFSIDAESFVRFALDAIDSVIGTVR